MAHISGWLHLTTHPKILIVRSQVYELREHYLNQLKQSVQCPGDGCMLCAEVPLRQQHCVAVSPFDRHDVYLLKIPPTSSPFATLLRELGPALPSTLITAAKLGAAAKGELELRIAGREERAEIDCRAYVASIGRRAYLLAAGTTEGLLLLREA